MRRRPDRRVRPPRRTKVVRQSRKAVLYRERRRCRRQYRHGPGPSAAPDGYTILIVPTNFVINPALYDKVPYDPYKDFDPVTLAVTSPMCSRSIHRCRRRRSSELVAFIKPIRASTAMHRRNRLAGTSRRRAVPPVARARSCPCPVQQRGPGGRLDDRRPHADCFTSPPPTVPQVRTASCARWR